ncbi:MAG: hypothetical protein ACODAU_10740 [Myxococcota bacterium]
MDSGLQVVAAPPRRKLIQLRLGRAEVARRIAATTAAFAERLGPPLSGWHRMEQADGGVRIRLCPVQEGFEIALSKQAVVCTARTSGAGPGYHAVVVDLLDTLAEELGVHWHDARDDTGYFEHRDFGRLQLAMAHSLRELASTIVRGREPPEGGHALFLDIPDRPLADAFAVSPMGEWGRTWFEEVAEADDRVLQERAAELYPWWERGLGPRVLRNLALSTCWVHVPWTRPAGELERAAYEAALGAAERARREGGLELPGALESELRRVMGTDVDEVPAEEGIGFRRRVMVRPLAGRWTMKLPGYYHAGAGGDDAERVYFFRDRVVRARSSAFQARGESPEVLLRRVSPLTDPVPLPLEAEHVAGHFTSEWSPEEERFVLRATVVKADGACFVSIGFRDEADGVWARQVAGTVSVPGLGERQPVTR